jgi:predicted RND superfamily exporter protein
MNALLDALARFVTERRTLAVLVVVVPTIVMGTFLRSLVADPTPSRLTSSGVVDAEEVEARFVEAFGDPDRIALLVVQAEDVLAPEALTYLHRLSESFEDADYVERVESLTAVRLRLPGAAEEEEEELSLDDLETLDELDDEPDVDPEIEAALGRIAAAEPLRFPLGLQTIAARAEDFRVARPVDGDEATDEEAAALRAALDDLPLLTGRLISEDRTTTVVVLRLRDLEEHQALAAAVSDIDARLAALPPPAGVTVLPGGLPHLWDAIVDNLRSDNARLIPLTVLVCLLLLYISFRWVPGMALPIVAVGLSAVTTLGTMGAVGETLNVLTNLLPALLIIIGVSDSIHLVARYREELTRGVGQLEAARRTVRAMATACFLTSLTTSVGLASLVVSQTEMLRRFGLLAGYGVLIAYVVTIVFLPAGLVSFRPPKVATRHEAKDAPDRGPLERWLVGLTLPLLRRPARVVTAAAVIFVAASFTAFGVVVDSHLLDQFGDDTPTARATHLMEEELDGVRPLEILLESDRADAFRDPAVLGAMDEVAAWLEAQPGVLSTMSVADHLHEAWAPLAGDPAVRDEPFVSVEQVEALTFLLRQGEGGPIHLFLTEDDQTARLQVRLADVGARATLDLVSGLREHLDDALEGLGVRYAFTGNAYTGSVGLDAVVQDLLGSLGLAVVIIFALLAMLFGSFRLGILSIPPNVIPLVGTVAWMALRGIPLNAATVIVFSISLGLAVDGTIHVLARYREEVGRGLGRSPALLRAARGTGRAIVVSGVVLMLGFGVMLLSSFLPVRRFAELIAVTVGSCLVSTLVVQPALLRLFAPGAARFRKPEPLS